MVDSSELLHEWKGLQMVDSSELFREWKGLQKGKKRQCEDVRAQWLPKVFVKLIGLLFLQLTPI